MKYVKLRAKMIEKGYNCKSLANALRISVNALSRKMNGNTQFKSNEIENISTLLRLQSAEEVMDIFLPALSHICNDRKENSL